MHGGVVGSINNNHCRNNVAMIAVNADKHIETNREKHFYGCCMYVELPICNLEWLDKSD
jgi:hypothetical protein